jgi:hypothetical protein
MLLVSLLLLASLLTAQVLATETLTSEKEVAFKLAEKYQPSVENIGKTVWG